MKLIRFLTFIGLINLYSAQLIASNVNDFPEAYAGLNHKAYHQLELTGNKSSQLNFKLQGKVISVNLQSAIKSHEGNRSFSQLIPGGFISGTEGENSLFGHMHLHNKHYILTTNHAGIWAVELPQSGLHFNQCGLNHNHEHAFDINSTDNVYHDKSAGTIIDVLIIYDQAIADRYPGNLLQTRVDQYFHVANQSYANSNLDLAVRQVGLEQVNYNFNDANINARNLLQEILSLGIGSSGFENVPLLRNRSGADLVIFLRTHDIETRGNCGIAFFPVPINTGLDHSYGVNIMADGMSSWSICSDQLMAHEIGHNLGAGHHNWDPTQFGFSAEARGFAKIGQFGTVMGSFGTGQADRFFELNYFSSPNIQCGGGACGIPGIADNVSVINQFKGGVANYLPRISNAPTPEGYTLELTDLDGDGVLDDTDEFPFDPEETTDSDGDGVGDNKDAFPQSFNLQIDSDGDGIGDGIDLDDDNDGTLDELDAFPLDADEVKDSDSDGVGDQADDFAFENSESKDYDGDGLGNNSDPDDDNDQVNDVSDTSQDLLVINIGNNRMLRFDAQTGLAKGIEVLPNDGLFTFQSDMAYDDQKQILYYSSASSIRSHDLLERDRPPKLLLPAYANDGGPQLGTGFPTALSFYTINGSPHLAVAKLRATSIDSYFLQNPRTPTQSLFAELATEEDATENVIDMYWHNSQMYVLSQNTNALRISQTGNIVTQIGSANMSWLVDPYAFVVTHDGIMIHTDQSRNMLVMTDATAGTFAGILANFSELGYSNPTGIELTDDGRVLVAVSDQNAILQFNLNTGEYLGELVSGFGLNQPHKILLVPQLQDRFHEDENKVLRPNAGNWYNPSSSGRGFNIGIFDNRLQVLWFTYDNDGNPIWYTSADFLLGHNYSADLLKTKQHQDGTVTVDTIGQISLEFFNEREAMMSWQIDQDSGQEPIQWLQFSVEPDIEKYTGMWTRADAPGWGTAVINNGEKTVVIPFIYDDQGEPRWAISDVAEGLHPFNFNMVTVFSDTLCPTCSGESDYRLESSGTMNFDLSKQPYWSSDFIWPTPLSGDWDLNQTDLVRISSEPTRPR